MKIYAFIDGSNLFAGSNFRDFVRLEKEIKFNERK